jgi:hypothetical protein
MITYTADTPYSQRSPRRAHRQSSDALVFDAKETVEHWKSAALRGESITGCRGILLTEVVFALRAERDMLLEEARVDEAQNADKAMLRARDQSVMNLKCEARDSLQGDLQRRLRDAEDELHNFQELTNRQESNMNAQFDDELRTLRSNHESQLQNLDADWTGVSRERKYNRTSGLLRTLRTQAALLLKERKYDESRSVERRADALESFETDSCHRRMEADYFGQLKLMEERHAKEEEEMARKHNLRRGEWQAARDFEMSVATQKVDNLKKEIEEMQDPEKVWSLYHRTETDPFVLRGCVAGRRPLDVGQFNQLELPPLRASTVAKKTLKRFNRIRTIGT